MEGSLRNSIGHSSVPNCIGHLLVRLFVFSENDPSLINRSVFGMVHPLRLETQFGFVS